LIRASKKENVSYFYHRNDNMAPMVVSSGARGLCQETSALKNREQDQILRDRRKSSLARVASRPLSIVEAALSYKEQIELQEHKENYGTVMIEAATPNEEYVGH
jgi:hypothetical protein